MKVYFKNLPFIVFFITLFASAQCDRVETIVICDMTTIDGNSDGTPDGVINLYDEYTSQIGGTLAPGTWFDPGFNFALDEATGDLFLWDLDNSSETITDYQFELTNPSCATGLTLTINLVLGPFSGFFNDPDGKPTCDLGVDPCMSMSFYNLYDALTTPPVSHSNGQWVYNGASPNFISLDADGNFSANIPYQPGPPITDQETFEFDYVVPGIAPCAMEMRTTVKINVIREVFSGFANEINLCESEILTGAYDNIDLRDDQFLVNEDIEGTWLAAADPTGQISGPADSIINLREVYDDLIAVNPRFGCETYEYSYSVDPRPNSSQCNTTKISEVKFTFHEELRPFSQTIPDPAFCVGDPTVPPTVNLYDYLEFTTEGTTLFDYPSDCCTNWTLVSGPSNLELISNTVGDECSPIVGYSHLGTINTSNLDNTDAGTYVFEYLVRPEANCGCGETAQIIYDLPNGCSNQTNTDGLCGSETGQVTIIINPINYAGEDTPTAPVPALEICETTITGPVDLISLLNVDGVNGPIYVGPLGEWTNLDTGLVITNPFTFPDVDGNQTFNFNYSTTTAPVNCPDSANLTITIYEEFSVGDDTTLDVCETDASFNIFDELDGDPSDNGTWTLPDGTVSPGNDVTFDPSTSDEGVYIYSVPGNTSTTDPSVVVCPPDRPAAQLTINVIENTNPGMDGNGEVCETATQFDLLTIVDPAADVGGTFVDVNATGALSGSIVDITALTPGNYTFQYLVIGNPVCTDVPADLFLTIFEAYSAGDPSTVDICISDSSFNIFDELEGNPSTNGRWTLPDGSMSSDNNVTFEPGTSDPGVYTYTTFPNMSTIDPTVEICLGDSETLTINVFESPNTGVDNDGVACKSDLEFDLLTLVDPAADTGGDFIDVDVTGALSGSIVDLTLLAEGDYTFQYQIVSTFCPLDPATLTLTVTDLLAPTVNNESFCVLDAATLADLTVNGASDFEWYDTATSTTPLDIDTILINGEDYFIAGTDSSGTCFSSRTAVIANIIPYGEGDCVIEIPDGVSPNDDMQNDDLDLSNLPQIYPNFEIKIFNRYGTKVFIGNANTEFFSGKSNVSLSIGENLPSGNYFYVFDPRDNITKPFQGNFYLSR